MRRFLCTSTIALLALGITGCGQESAAEQTAAPKGDTPTIVTAPPGTTNPQDRAAALEKGGGDGPAVDGGSEK